ncbi:MAG: thioredoxin family protein, partial [Lachnospiraceae bacterium]
LYNASGPGQTIDESQAARIRQIDREIRLKIMVSLSCTMCPELVTAAQRIAAESPLVTAEVYDLNHFPQLKEQYRVMSVPCMVMNDDQITFGKKDLGQVLDFIG